MQVPLEISIRDIEDRSWIENDVREQAHRLERFSDAIISCRVEVAQDNKQPRSGSPYRVRLEVSVPHKKHLIVKREHSQEGVGLKTMIHDAFHAMERQVKEAAQRRRYDVKNHDEEPRAFIVRLFPEQDYGFIKSPEGEEFYFHRHAVLHDDYDRLEVGTEVRFVREMGEMGPQASSVQIVSKPGARDPGSSPDDFAPFGWQDK
jgi:cold shock CspA family protein/ribosome-associated translation inhibitor RaiA